jgi:hypothetical protein
MNGHDVAVVAACTNLVAAVCCRGKQGPGGAALATPPPNRLVRCSLARGLGGAPTGCHSCAVWQLQAHTLVVAVWAAIKAQTIKQ